MWNSLGILGYFWKKMKKWKKKKKYFSWGKHKNEKKVKIINFLRDFTLYLQKKWKNEKTEKKAILKGIYFFHLFSKNIVNKLIDFTLKKNGGVKNGGGPK